MRRCPQCGSTHLNDHPRDPLVQCMEESCGFTFKTGNEMTAELELALKSVANQLLNRGLTFIEIAVDPATKEIAWRFTPTPN